MGNIGWWQILIVAVLVVLLFGRGKISDLMGDVAQGIKNFRKGMADDDADDEPSETAALLSGDDDAVEMKSQTDQAAKT